MDLPLLPILSSILSLDRSFISLGFRKLEAKILDSSRPEKKTLLDGLRINTSGYFAHCSHFPRKYRKMSTRFIC